MTERRFNVVFQQELVDGYTQEQVQENLARLLDIETDEADYLFYDEPVVVRTNLDKDQAMSLRLAFFRAGAKCLVEDQDPDLAPKPEHERVVTCPHCGHVGPPARECSYCGMRMKEPKWR